MNPQPPVTKMRIAARTSSSDQTALAEFPFHTTDTKVHNGHNDERE
jgi:hypothetical protein